MSGDGPGGTSFASPDITAAVRAVLCCFVLYAVIQLAHTQPASQLSPTGTGTSLLAQLEQVEAHKPIVDIGPPPVASDVPIGAVVMIRSAVSGEFLETVETGEDARTVHCSGGE